MAEKPKLFFIGVSGADTRVTLHEDDKIKKTLLVTSGGINCHRWQFPNVYELTESEVKIVMKTFEEQNKTRKDTHKKALVIFEMIPFNKDFNREFEGFEVTRPKIIQVKPKLVVGGVTEQKKAGETETPAGAATKKEP